MFAKGGFDCVLGNPPWERVKLQEKEWFAERNPGIANAPNAAARKRLIEGLKAGDPGLYRWFLDDLRKAEGESHLIRNSGRYPLCGRGDINTYAVFAEGMRNLLNDRGRVGCVVPTGVATDDTTKFFFRDVVEKKSLISLLDFENKGVFFPDVHSSFKFCLFTSGRGTEPSVERAEFVFFARSTADLLDPHCRFTLTREEISLLNPNTHTCPIFRSTYDAELTKAAYRKVSVLVQEGQSGGNLWGIALGTMFHMTNDSELFLTREQLEGEGWTRDGNLFRRGKAAAVPLYEGRMIDHYDHRAASVGVSEENVFRSGVTLETSKEQHSDPGFSVLPRYWVPLDEVRKKLPSSYHREWFLGFKDVTSATNERTFISSAFPLTGVGNTIPLFLSDWTNNGFPSFIANLSSFAFDFVARQKIGGVHPNFFIVKQLAVLPPAFYDSRVLGEEIPKRLKIGFCLGSLNSHIPLGIY